MIIGMISDAEEVNVVGEVEIEIEAGCPIRLYFLQHYKCKCE